MHGIEAGVQGKYCSVFLLADSIAVNVGAHDSTCLSCIFRQMKNFRSALFDCRIYSGRIYRIHRFDSCFQILISLQTVSQEE